MSTLSQKGMRLVACFAFVLSLFFTASAIAQDSITPEVFQYNMTCKNASDADPSIKPWGIKLNRNDPNGTFAFIDGEDVVMMDGGPSYPDKSITISSDSSHSLGGGAKAKINNWNSSVPLRAIILKVGNTSYLYKFGGKKYSGGALTTNDTRGISHISGCYDRPDAPTAGELSVTGRVVDANGKGIARAQMFLVDGATGETRLALTNPFGYYTFAGLEPNDVYVMNISHKRFRFSQNQHAFSLTENATGFDFVADDPFAQPQ